MATSDLATNGTSDASPTSPGLDSNEEILDVLAMQEKLSDPNYNNPNADPNGSKLMAEAESKLASSKSFLGKIFNGAQKIEEAAELFHDAGNSFKTNKNWDLAGNAYIRSGEVQLQLDSKHDTALCFINAANAYKKINMLKAADTQEKAVEIYRTMGRFSIAAKNQYTLAEMYEAIGDLGKAGEHYMKAADLYSGEESISSSNKCRHKAASLYALRGDFAIAIKLFDIVINSSLKSKLLSYSVKDYMFKSLLLQILLNNRHDLNNKITNYCTMHNSFQDTRELKLVNGIIDALDERELEKLNEAIDDYDKISRFDAWHKNIIGQIRKLIDKPYEDDGAAAEKLGELQ